MKKSFIAIGITALIVFAGGVVGLKLTNSGVDEKPSITRPLTDHDRIVALDKRMTKLESDLAEFVGRTQDYATNTRAIFQNLTTMTIKMKSDVDDAISVMAADSARLQAHAPVAKSAPTMSTPRREATRDGVPLSVYNQIRADAERRFPTNFEMQEYIIKNQIESYRKLNP